jgi:hypothetical protein
MRFLENLFRAKKQAESVVLIGIGENIVCGACVRYEDGRSPTAHYTRSLPVTVRDGEERERAVLRTLRSLGDDLIREGAPALARAIGNGVVSTILVAVDAPWQKVLTRTEYFEQREPFTFTEDLVEKRLAETDVVAPDEVLVDKSIIGATLNGYATNAPYGKEARRASITVLTSLVKLRLKDSVTEIMRGLYHTRDIRFIGGSSLRYQTARSLFPHDRDAIIIDATDGLTSIALVREGVFVTLANVMAPIGGDGWAEQITKELDTVSVRHPLPRIVFLLAQESEALALRQDLDTDAFAALWRSAGAMPKVVSVLKTLIGGSVRQLSAEPVGLNTLLMTLYYQRHASTKPSF